MSNKEYEYKFDTVKSPEDRVYDDRVMHYYENHSNEPARSEEHTSELQSPC